MFAVVRRGVPGFLIVCLALSAQQLAPAHAQEASTETSSYLLGSRDLLRIRVFELPELNVDSRVSAVGTISLPLIGDVAASGLTESELEARLKQILESRYVNRASVSIEVLEARSRPITLLGALRSPGSLAVPGRWTLLDAIIASGGLADNHGDRIFVLRRATNELSDQLVIEVDDLLLRGRPEANIAMQSGDLVNIPVRSNVSVYCLGAVASPGEIQFSSTERISLLAVLVRAGGLTDRASKKIRVKRRQGSTFGEETIVDYRRILSGDEPDPTLSPGDVVVVKESLF